MCVCVCVCVCVCAHVCMHVCPQACIPVILDYIVYGVHMSESHLEFYRTPLNINKPYYDHTTYLQILAVCNLQAYMW